MLSIWEFFFLILGCYSLSIPFLAKKAQIKYWKLGFLPVINFYVWINLIGRKWWWLIPLVFPGVNIYMLMVMQANVAIVFGRSALSQVHAAINPFYLIYLALKKNLEYKGPFYWREMPKSRFRRNVESLIFAVIVVAIIRMYFVELYLIPTSSMEQNLRAGDFLIISKFHYGLRFPMTPLSIPFMHHSIFLTNIKAFTDIVQWPYIRLPALMEIKRGSIVAFNFPEGDTVLLDEQNRSYYQIVREQALKIMADDIIMNKQVLSFSEYIARAREKLLRERDWTVRPIDKKENYVKRCVALPGDTIYSVNGVIFVNYQRLPLTLNHQFYFIVKCKSFLSKDYFISRYDVNPSEIYQVESKELTYLMGVSLRNALHMKNDPAILSITPYRTPPSGNKDLKIFPNTPIYNWSEDTWGPIIVPKKGQTIKLNSSTLPFYERVIRDYEKNDFVIKDGRYYINGIPADSYTFKQNYYFMIGDNYYNSLDSRYWGFVPEDHIMGRPILILISFSYDSSKPLLKRLKIRTDRILKIPI